MKHSCVLGEDNSLLIITPWVCQELLSSSGHFMDSLHLMKCRFMAEFSIQNSQTCFTHIWEIKAQEHITKFLQKHVCDVMTWIEMIHKVCFFIDLNCIRIPGKGHMFSPQYEEPKLNQSFSFSHQLNRLLSAQSMLKPMWSLKGSHN